MPANHQPSPPDSVRIQPYHADLVRAALLLTVLLAPPVRAAPPDCARAARPFVNRGTVSEGAACDVWVVAGDAAVGGVSEGTLGWPDPVTAPPYRLELTVQRLTPDGRHSMEIGFLGGWIVVRDGEAGLYTSEAQFARDGFRAAPGLDTRRAFQVVIVHADGEVRWSIDGREVGREPTARTNSSFVTTVKGPPGTRPRMLVRGYRVEALSRTPSAARTPGPAPR